MNPPLIFIQIASYRDTELLPTIRDCIARASLPGNLTFGICWQRDTEESLGEFVNDPRFKIFETTFERSRGTCWARSKTQELYNNEKFTLQIDSHHRFVENWDNILINMLTELQENGYKKPVLTSYAPVYDPLNDPDGREIKPLRISFNGFRKEGPFALKPETIDEFDVMSEPEPARFLSAHFIFTIGKFCTEVAYDPNLYFFGEEPSLSIRAYTFGYDFFHPHKIILWHYYGRNIAPKHWVDHQRWIYRNERSMNRYSQLIQDASSPGASFLGVYGLGKERTLQGYQNYAGINLSIRGVSNQTLANLPPCNNNQLHNEEDPNNFIHVFWQIVIAFENIEYNDDAECYDFFYIGTHSEDGEELVRQDLNGTDLSFSITTGCYLLEFYSYKKPATWTVWPYNKNLGWELKTTKSI